MNFDRDSLRQCYFDTWKKMQAKLPLDPTESQIASVIEMHPEYHKLLSHPEKSKDKEYLPDGGETNPFLHMGLHLGIIDQVTTDKPEGIRAVYQKLVKQSGDPHEAEHQMMQCLVELICEAQENSSGERDFFERIKALLH